MFSQKASPGCLYRGAEVHAPTSTLGLSALPRGLDGEDRQLRRALLALTRGHWTFALARSVIVSVTSKRFSQFRHRRLTHTSAWTPRRSEELDVLFRVPWIPSA